MKKTFLALTLALVQLVFLPVAGYTSSLEEQIVSPKSTYVYCVQPQLDMLNKTLNCNTIAGKGSSITEAVLDFTLNYYNQEKSAGMSEEEALGRTIEQLQRAGIENQEASLLLQTMQNTKTAFLLKAVLQQSQLITTQY